MKLLNAILFCLSVSIVTLGSAVAENRTEVGISIPLSGPLNSFGVAISNGIKLAEEQTPEKFERIKFIIDDNRYDAKTALASFNNLYRRPNIQLVFMWGSPTCMAVAPIAERSQRPLICFSGDSKPHLQYVMSFNNPAQDYASIIAKHLKTRELGRVGLVYSEIPFYVSLADALVQHPNAARSILFRESISPDAQDLSTLASKLKAQRLDTIVLFLVPSQISTVSKQFSRVGFHPTIIGADTFSDTAAMRDTSGSFRNAAYVDMAVDPTFAKEYQRKYQDGSNITFAFNGYHFALLVGDLFDGANHPLSSGQLLAKLRAYEGSRTISYRRDQSFGQYFAFPIELKRCEESGEIAEKKG